MRFASSADAVRARLPNLRSFVAIGEDGPDWAVAYEALLAKASPDEPEAEVDEGDPYYFNLTSGTTGLPKSYLLTQYNNALVGPMFEAFETTSSDVFMTVFPAFERVGFAWIAAGVQFGARNVLTDFQPAEVLRLIESERVTIANATRRGHAENARPFFAARPGVRRSDVPRAAAASRGRRAMLKRL
jgi:acyl-CoA synthetase (AMP-forming)/AMP-acid ligase II